MKKKLVIFFLAAAILLTMSACGGKTEDKTTTLEQTTAETTAPTTEANDEIFDLAGLAKNDGKDGAKAYIAYKGKVYDVTGVKEWESGTHFGLSVGTDITEKLSGCKKHELDFLEKQFASYPVVGNLKVDETDSRTGDDTASYKAEDLAKYDGKDGAKAYNAYNGKDYDVTGVKEWESGAHFGLSVGTDITEKLSGCKKHELDFLEKQFASYNIVGTYVAE